MVGFTLFHRIFCHNHGWIHSFAQTPLLHSFKYGDLAPLPLSPEHLHILHQEHSDTHTHTHTTTTTTTSPAPLKCLQKPAPAKIPAASSWQTLPLPPLPPNAPVRKYAESAWRIFPPPPPPPLPPPQQQQQKLCCPAAPTQHTCPACLPGQKSLQPAPTAGKSCL